MSKGDVVTLEKMNYGLEKIEALFLARVWIGDIRWVVIH